MPDVSSYKIGIFCFAYVHDYLIKNKVFRVGKFCFYRLRIKKNSPFYDSIQKNIYGIWWEMEFWPA